MQIIQVNGNPTRKLKIGIPGWVKPRDLLLLASIAQMMPDNSIIAEAGCYLGRSSYAIGANLNPTCRLHCIDIWSTEFEYFSVNSQVRQFDSGRTLGSKRNMDLAAKKASRTNSWYDGWEHFTYNCKNITPFKSYIADYQVPADLKAVFIDGTHTYDEVLKDIRKFNINPEVLLIGDDFCPSWQDVLRAVGTVKEETKKTLYCAPDSAAWFLWPQHGHWADKLTDFMSIAERDLAYINMSAGE
jgi:hypothetical protein